MNRLLLLSLAGLTSFAMAANADILANYPFTSSSRASTDVNPDSAASSFGDGAGITSAIDVTRGNAAPSVGVVSDQIDASTNAGAVTANDYVTFTLTPSSESSRTSGAIETPAVVVTGILT